MEVETDHVDDESLLWRFLYLGIDKSVYRPSQCEITTEASIIDRLIQRGRGEAVVKWIKDSKDKCCKFYPLAYTLAICAKCNMSNVRQQALEAIRYVCNTPSQLCMFLSYCAEIDEVECGCYLRNGSQRRYKRVGGIARQIRLRSWPRQFRRGIAEWYVSNPRYQEDIMLLAKHVTKYQCRNKFTHKRIIKACHPKARNEEMNYIFCYIVKGLSKANQIFQNVLTNGQINDRIKEYFTDFESLKNVPDSDVDSVVNAINKWDLSWEHIPAKWLKHSRVWKTLLMREMPLMALIRNLGKAGSMELLMPGSDEENRVCERLTNIDIVNGSKLHPIDIISALTGYRRGEGCNERTWPINERIVKALYKAYLNKLSVRPSTDKRLLLAINIKMKFDKNVVGKRWLTCKQAAAALAMMLTENERAAETVTFGHLVRRFDFPRHDQGIEDVETALERIASIREEGNEPLSFSAPFIYATGREEPFDAIILITDRVPGSKVQEIQSAFSNYKQHHPTAKCITVHFKHSETTANPTDSSMLDVMGVDAYAVEIMQDFILGYHEDMRNILQDIVDLRI